MSTKINLVLKKLPYATVATSRWLNEQGVDHRLADQYVRSGWLERIGHGAYIRAGSSVDWAGGVHALQTQLGLDVHPGGITAVELRGYAHYLPLGKRLVILFAKPGVSLPAWFVRYQWSHPVKLTTCGAFKESATFTSTVKVGSVEIAIATLELAAFEMFYQVPNQQSYEEALQVMESLGTIRPTVVQRLLEDCTSIKTKRLFMHAAEQVGHLWLAHLDLSSVEFGSGRRSIHKGGKLNAKYNLVVEDPIQR